MSRVRWLFCLILLCAFSSIAVADEPPAAINKRPASIGKTSANPYSLRLERTKESDIAAGGTEESEKAVASALDRLIRHQNGDGSWGCHNCLGHCRDETCKTDQSGNLRDYSVAATAFGLLPLFAAGMANRDNSPHQDRITKGLTWLASSQNPKSGQLGSGSMYEHALGTIALCEAYGLTRDPHAKLHAEMAVGFLEDAQNDESGGWHYIPNPPTVGDLSVTGWQVTALKMAELASLNVKPQTIQRAKTFLATVAKGKSNGLGCYTPNSGPTPTMTAVSLLCHQQLGRTLTDPAQDEGRDYVLANEKQAASNLYFHYYAAQVLHNLPDPACREWIAALRDQLVCSQETEGCAAGSWSPKGRGHVAGRLMSTSFAALTLQVYYRHPPVYQPDPKPQP